MKNFLFFMLGMIWGIVLIFNLEKSHDLRQKPISYPEEIQIAKAGDTLIVNSVSDSIYIGFKHLNK